jgi:glycosyltransferase involved in cell wall biosynthesis
MIRSNNKIIIIGTLPPPIGGVSIYNERLFDFLQQEEGIDVDFIDYKRHSLPQVLKALSGHKIIYLNCSSSLFRLALALISRLMNKKFIVTFHGNVERHTKTVNVIDKLILKLATLSIVLNRQSFNFAIRYSKRVFLGTSFIAPVTPKELSPDLKTFIAGCRKNYKIICSSNAHNVSADKFGNEIYQIRFLLDIFRELKDCCIILSDPSGMYSNYLLKNSVDIPPNVFVIKETHSYFELLKETDVMLRITTTDGDSISVREALYLHKIVIASNAVDRPAGVITVNISKEEIKGKLQQVIDGKIHPEFSEQKNAGEQMLKIFASLSQ